MNKLNLPKFHWAKFLSIILFILLLGSYIKIFAIAEPYDPGETLDPSCPPGEINCTVLITGGGMVYPGAGISNSTGGAWGISYSTTGSGTVVALATSPILITPTLGVATATSINSLTLTSALDGFTVAGGTTPRTLTVTGANASISGTHSGTSSGTNTGDQTTITGNAGSATYASAVTLTADNSTNSINYPLFVDTATGNLSPRTDTGFNYNPSTGLLTSTGFVGDLTGNITGSSSSFTGNLSGEVTGPQGTTVVSNAAVIGKVLTGYISGAGTVASTDTILQAIQKLNGNITAGSMIYPGAGISVSTGSAWDTSVTSSSGLITNISDEIGTGRLVFNDSPVFTTNITTPLVVGGTSTVAPLILRSTSGSGTTGADIIFQAGSNGATETMRILNNGRVGIGTSSPNSLFQVANLISFDTAEWNTEIGQEAGAYLVSGAQYNTFLGHQAGRSGTSGGTNAADNNTAIGYRAMYANTTGASNTAIGTLALTANTTGNSNSAIGVRALFSNTIGYNNTANGMYALNYNLSGNYNNANGQYSLYNNTVGSYNTAFGNYSLNANVAGSNATAFGYNAMQYANSTATPFTNYNIGIGYEALRGTITAANNIGNYNTAIGYQSSYGYETADRNTTIGYFSGRNNVSGDNNLLIGHQAGESLSSGSTNIAIGYDVELPSNTANNQMTIGNLIFATGGFGTGTTIGTGNVGIGLNNPTARLHLPAGTATANTAPLKLTSGINLTSAEAGAMEWDGTNLFITQTTGPTRKTLAYTSDILGSPITIVNTSNLFSTGLAGSGQGVVAATYSNFFGPNAGSQATGANSSNFFGYQAGRLAITAQGSNFFGQSAGNTATNANDSNFFGYQAGYAASAASNSNFFGNQAGQNATNGTFSNFIGRAAGLNATNARNSIFIGQNAGNGDTVTNMGNVNDFSILIGQSTSTGGFSNSIALGGFATNTAANQFMIGSSTRPINTTVWTGASGTATLDTATGLITTSDERLKKNIIDLEDTTLSKLINVRTVKFNWLNGDSDKTNIGFLAQDLEQYFPELVYTGTDDYKGVNYANMTPIIVEAIREMDLKIKEFDEKINNLSMSEMMKEFFGEVLVRVTDGVGYLKNIAVENLKIGSPERRTGITLYDEETGEPYCLSISGGETKIKIGECGIVTPPRVEIEIEEKEEKDGIDIIEVIDEDVQEEDEEKTTFEEEINIEEDETQQEEINEKEVSNNEKIVSENSPLDGETN